MEIKGGPTSRTHRKNPENSAPGSDREQNTQESIINLIAGFGTASRASRELSEYKINFRESVRHQLESNYLDPKALTIFDLTATTNGLNFLYMEYNDGSNVFAFCEYFEESFKKSDEFIPHMNENYNDINYNVHNQNSRNIETMDEKCKAAIKHTVDNHDKINVKIPYVTNAIDIHSYDKYSLHALYIVKQIASIYLIQSVDQKISKVFPRRLRINMYYVHGEKLRNLMHDMYPNGILPRCDVGMVAVATDTHNRFGTGPGAESKILGIITGYMDFVENNVNQPRNPFQQPGGQYTPIFKTTSIMNHGQSPFTSLIMISGANQFFCGDERNWTLHMRDEGFLHNIANIGNLFFNKKEKENSKQEIISFKTPSEVDMHTSSPHCFTKAVMALEIVDSHFADPILNVIDRNETSKLLTYLRNFTDLTIPDDAIQSLLFSQSMSIIGTIQKNAYEKNSIEIDSRHYTTYLDLLHHFPECHQDQQLKPFLFINDNALISKVNFIDKQTRNGFKKKFKSSINILSDTFLRTLAEIIITANINLVDDESYNGNVNLSSGSLSFNNDFFSKFGNIPTVGKTGSNFSVQHNAPFNTSPF